MRRTNAERAGDQAVAQRAVDALGRDAQQQPSRRAGEISFLMLQIIDGNTIDDDGTTTFGVLRQNANVTTVAQDYDPTRGGQDNAGNVLSQGVGQFTAEDGIGRAILIRDNVPLELVLVVHDPRSPGAIPDLIGHGSDFAFTLGAISIPIGNGGRSILAYVPYLL